MAGGTRKEPDTISPIPMELKSLRKKRSSPRARERGTRKFGPAMEKREKFSGPADGQKHSSKMKKIRWDRCSLPPSASINQSRMLEVLLGQRTSCSSPARLLAASRSACIAQSTSTEARIMLQTITPSLTSQGLTTMDACTWLTCGWGTLLRLKP